MPQFPNYYQTQMPSYQNNYQQPMMNMSNPYMDRLSQLQQYQQSLQGTQMSLSNQFATLGKFVESIEIVKTTDVPMDGNMYYFPKADGTEVYAKHWLPNGTTEILTFKPIFDSQTNNLPQEELKNDLGAFSDVLGGIQNDLKTLNDKIDKLSKPATTSKGKKEVENE